MQMWGNGGGVRRRVPRIAAQKGVARAPPSGQSAPGCDSEPIVKKGRGLPGRGGQWDRGGAGPGRRHVRPRTCPRGAAAGGAGPAPGHRDRDTGTAAPARGHRHGHRRTCPGTPTAAGKRGQRHRQRDTDTGTVIPAPGQGREQRHRDRDSGTTAGAGGSRQPRLELNAARGSPGGANPAMEPPARACSCGSPASDSGAEAESCPGAPPKPSGGRKRPGGLERGSPNRRRPRAGGSARGKGRAGMSLPAMAIDSLPKVPGAPGLHPAAGGAAGGLRRGRYDRGLSSFQQSVAMDRLQRIIGVLQKPEMGARYLGTLLQVEAMLRLWFPHVAPKPALDSAPPAAPPRRRPPAGAAGAPRCRRLPGSSRSAAPRGPFQQRGAPESPPAPDV
ncbi:circadian-associated transcriptional repressor [Ammospiza nelsoni]|uniref:circadian-associated transcriptional repressor n=1 Tax=Ammospiza nelsoni TaxID=2857394 RepID=UPI00286B83A3|nr:circadian-associated transcriptional repressor [Ammospiza nelsoni]